MTVEFPTAAVWTRDGATKIADLPLARGITWQRQVSAIGWGGFEYPLADWEALAWPSATSWDRCIVRFTYRGAVRQAVILDEPGVARAVDGRRWITFDRQPDVNGLLKDSVVKPEYGQKRRSGNTRTCGWMSKRDGWYNASQWLTPIGYVWTADTTVRKNYPPDFSRYPTAQWISVAGPDASVAAGAVNYFRREFTLASSTTVSFLFTGDNFTDVWIDGELVQQADKTQPYAWRVASVITMTLDPGDHVFGARVENASFTTGINPIAFICVARTLNNKGVPNGVLWQTDTSSWVCAADPEPSWHRASILKQFVTEKQARDTAAGAYSGCSVISIAFTDTLDTAGVAFTDQDGEQQFDINSANLADIATQLAEKSMDWQINPATLALEVWLRQGDKTNATVLDVGDAGGALKSYNVARSAASVTSIATHLADDTWLEIGSNVGTWGLLEAGMSQGSTSSRTAATANVDTQLRETASERYSVTNAQASTLAGPQLFVDYDLADTVTGRKLDGSGTVRVRLVSVTVNASGEVVQAYPDQLVVDNS